MCVVSLILNLKSDSARKLVLNLATADIPKRHPPTIGNTNMAKVERCEVQTTVTSLNWVF